MHFVFLIIIGGKYLNNKTMKVFNVGVFFTIFYTLLYVYKHTYVVYFKTKSKRFKPFGSYHAIDRQTDPSNL